MNTSAISAFRMQQDDNKMYERFQNLRDQISKTPPRKPGDEYTIFGALAGVIVGIILGVYFGMPWVFIVGIIGGGIVGTYLGSVWGERNARNHPPKGPNQPA